MLLVLPALVLGGCRERPGAPVEATEPAAAVVVLSRHLRNNDLAGFARSAVPPELLPALAEAWNGGRTRWPLEELPFDHKIPSALASLSADQAERTWRRGFDRQFANANGEIRSAATALGLFGVKYIQGDARLSEDERRHYPQLVSALSDWAQQARLGDPKRAHRAIAQLTDAARQTGLREEADFRRYGMDESLRRLTPFVAAFKRSLRDYGLDLDRSLDAMEVSLESQDGDRARVRMRYPLAADTVDAVIGVERVGGRWYVSDFLRHAREAAKSAPAPAPSVPESTVPESTNPGAVQPATPASS